VYVPPFPRFSSLVHAYIYDQLLFSLVHVVERGFGRVGIPPRECRDGCYATEGAEGDLSVDGSGDVVRRKGFESMC